RGEGFGASVVALDDGERDQVLAVLVAGGRETRGVDERNDAFERAGRARVCVFSPRTGALLREIELASGEQSPPLELADAGDWDGDGAHELLITFASEVRVASPRSGATLARFVGWGSVATAGDFDGDGAIDVCIGDPQRARGSRTEASTRAAG